MVALARHPGPMAPEPQLIPICLRIGPLTIVTIPHGCVVACTPKRSNPSAVMASTAAISTGRYSGRQPAITASSIPVFAGVGGGTTTGPRVVMLAKDAEALGAMAVVVNAPTTNEVIHEISKIVDIPVVITVLDENTDIDARIAAGAGILNISAAGKTPEVVAKIRAKYPEIPIIATGGPTRESIKRTIEAGANAISFTPPTAMDLFHGLMSRYRSEHESRTKEQTNE